MREVNLFLTHCHLDHVIGLPFFAPFFTEGYSVHIWAGNLLPGDNIEQVMRKLMSSPLFPVEVEIFKAKIEYHDFRSGDVLRPYDGVTLQTAPLDHPDGASGYRLEHDGRAFALLSDTEGFPGKHDRELVSLARGADLVVYDGTFTENEIASREVGGIRLTSAASAWPTRPRSSSCACFITIPRTTTISWMRLLPMQTMHGQARSWRAKARSSICNSTFSKSPSFMRREDAWWDPSGLTVIFSYPQRRLGRSRQGEIDAA